VLAIDSAMLAFCSTSSTEVPCSLISTIRSRICWTISGASPRRRLVEQQVAGLGHQRPADGQHLLLAAGQVAGDLLAPLGEPREQLVDAVEVVVDRARGRCGRRCAGSPRR
jgi:hypothetical protein